MREFRGMRSHTSPLAKYVNLSPASSLAVDEGLENGDERLHSTTNFREYVPAHLSSFSQGRFNPR
jgi:hypothetical protein